MLPLLVLIACWALLHTALVVLGDQPGAEFGLTGPDSFMRMVRVTELWNQGQWFDTTIERANAPYGDSLHWTRPFDILLILLSLPLSLVMGGANGLHLAGVLVSPLLQLATALLMIWTLRPLVRPNTWFVPALAALIQPSVLAYSMVGKADHHTLMILGFVATAGFMLRALRNPLDSRPALLAGLVVGLGIWVSVEFFLVAGVCLAALGLAWLFGERDRAAQNKWFALAMSGVLLVALVVERPFAQILEASYDKVSSVHYLLAVCILLFWRCVESAELRRGTTMRFVGRAAAAVVGCGSLVVLVAVVHPLFFAGPMAEVDPRILPIWLDGVLEMRPLFPNGPEGTARFILYLGGVVLVVPFIGLKLLSEGFRSDRFFAHLFILLCCVVMTAAALPHMRFAGYPEIAFLIAFSVVLDDFLHWTARIGNDLPRGFLRGGFIAVLLLGPVLVGITLLAKQTTVTATAATGTVAPQRCDVPAIARYLESDPRWTQAPLTILAFMDIGPELLYRTRHRVIGTPYHRNGGGIFDGYQALATSDEATAHALIGRRQVDLVLLCGVAAEEAFYTSPDGKENLYQRLARGDAPNWLAAVEVPPALAPQVRFYRVIR
ncbi:STT3 domain-containing protein [Pelagibius sp. 7325]|uniref:STT3 domain-containing protein n=1 Tax=Pelagibius sp. 7325 TaxID=3131994 RepID=UPI0030EC3D27